MKIHYIFYNFNDECVVILSERLTELKFAFFIEIVSQNDLENKKQFQKFLIF